MRFQAGERSLVVSRIVEVFSEQLGVLESDLSIDFGHDIATLTYKQYR